MKILYIPDDFLLYGYKIYSIWIILTLSFLFSLYAYWQTVIKDGFDKEKALDLLFLSGIAVLVLHSIAGLNNLNLYFTAILISSIIFAGFSFLWKWSIYRILDNLAYFIGFFISFVFLARIYSLKYIFVIILCAAYIYAYRKYRIFKVNSGVFYSVFLFLNVVVGLIYSRAKSDLIFYIIFSIMGLVVLYFRVKENLKVMDMKLFQYLKDNLLSKEKRLKNEDNLLKREDPYMPDDRSTGNSEEIDEAILEDSRKELLDLRRTSINNMRLQIRKALAKMKIGNYGVCEICKTPIDKARLKAYPEATKCVECERRAEENA